MELYILGAFLFVLIGVILSLLGSGGALLTIPVLVYIFDVDPYWATSYSMFIMGVSNWAATIDNIKKNLIYYKIGLCFAIPGLLVTFIIRRFILPIVPDVLFESDVLSFTKGSAIMLSFAILMFYTAIKTFRRKNTIEYSRIEFSPVINILQGAAIGLVTGFAGAGGGFLIVPALLFTVKMPMKEAAATSLFIISITTFLGFFGDFNPAIEMDWTLIIFCTAFSILGILITSFIKDTFSNKFLKTSFGYFILGLSLLVFYIEINKLGVFS